MMVSAEGPTRKQARSLVVGVVLWLVGLLGFVVVMAAMGPGRAFEHPILLVATFLLGTVGFVMSVVMIWRIGRARRRAGRRIVKVAEGAPS